MKALLTAVALLLCTSYQTQAEEVSQSESGLAIPRMVSLRSDTVNGRAGPSKKYPIEWIYQQKGAPVEIINEFELWRQIKDWEGSVSWVHKTMLTGRRFARVTTLGQNNIYAKAKYDSKVVAKVEDGAIGEILKCKKGNEFCLLRFENIEGYMPRKDLFGVYDDEEVEKSRR